MRAICAIAALHRLGREDVGRALLTGRSRGTALKIDSANSEVDARIGRRLCTLRWCARLTPARLAASAGMSLTDLEACESGNRRVRASEMFRLCSALRTPVASILIALR